ncbi:MAG TPA: penicillin-binding protein 2, partial [Campylobacterales bacterium]|nr:penicillin-binding protein 2 [Campylobacterales bacterium]
MNPNQSKKLKITFIFIIILFFFIVLIGALVHIATSDKRLPRLTITETDKAIHGNILSRNNFTISSSKKLYKAVVDTRNIDPAKKELFISLFSTFSNIDQEVIRKKIESKFGFVTLTYKLDSKTARYVKQLSKRLFALKVIRRYTDLKTNRTFLHGLEVRESGEYRFYPLGETLTPIIGYVRKFEKENYTTIEGRYGLEKYYAKELEGIQSTEIQGRRDARSNIILDNESDVKNRYDGYNVITSISLKLQKTVEQLLFTHREKLGAKEIMAAVMDSKTGNILTIASSRRFTPGKIKDADALTISAIRYIYEPGSIMKPIIYALLLEDKKINKDDIIKTYNGRFLFGKKVITDEHRYPYLSAENVIVHSSNIGMAQISQRLDPLNYFQGLRSFGFGRKTGIDLTYELEGSIPNIHQLKNSVYRATASYGYGIKVNFFHILQAYNIFNNEGLLIQPSIGEFIQSPSHKQEIFHKEPQRVLSKKTALALQKVLFKTVQEGTGKNAITEGIMIGGKTGTAQISVRGKYEEIYNNSFFGFANDGSHKYTIGVTVIEP